MALWAAKAAAGASRRLRRGGGTAVGGLVGLAIDPRLTSRLAADLEEGCVLVTGTNGKTTTARLIAATAAAAGLEPLANASGSNLMRGIAGALAWAAGAHGRIPGRRRLGVFEVDEAALPQALAALRPRALVFTNLFRDQLDRYGEVEAVAALWRDALASSPATPVVLNADDPSIASLGEGRKDVIYFGVDDPARDRGRPEHAADAVRCPCGRAYVYQVFYFGHLGLWRCPGCGRSRPPAGVEATGLDLDEGRRLRFRASLPDGAADVDLALGGLYNVYNALAALAAASALGLPVESTVAALAATSAAFGRQEVFDVDGRRVQVLLGKNPAGLNQVLDTLALDPERRNLLLVLNDLTADGRDVSWIWDTDFEAAAGRFARTWVAGHRALDMALRLKYARWAPETMTVEEDVGGALDAALAGTPPGAGLTVVPTYTAMLRVRELLARRARARPFWQT
jgi:UDP-N-acetylmuramyl tripeptide synthase